MNSRFGFNFHIAKVSRCMKMTREIIPYMLKIQEMFHAHQENNIVAPRGELTIPSPFEFSIPSRDRIDGKEKGGSGYYEAVTPSVVVPPPFRLPKHSMVYSWELSHHDNTDSFNKRPLPGAECTPKSTYNVIQTDNISRRLTLPRFRSSRPSTESRIALFLFRQWESPHSLQKAKAQKDWNNF